MSATYFHMVQKTQCIKYVIYREERKVDGRVGRRKKGKNGDRDTGREGNEC